MIWEAGQKLRLWVNWKYTKRKLICRERKKLFFIASEESEESTTHYANKWNKERGSELVCSFKSLTQCQGHWWEVDAGSPSGTGWQRIEMRMQKWGRRNADEKWGRQNAADKTRMTKCGWQNEDDKMRKGSCECGWWNPYEGKWTFDVFLQFHL